MNKQEIGNIIKKRREALSLKQEDLSEMSGITSKTIYLVENGKGNPSFDTIEKLLEIIGLDILVEVKKMDQ